MMVHIMCLANQASTVHFGVIKPNYACESKAERVMTESHTVSRLSLPTCFNMVRHNTKLRRTHNRSKGREGKDISTRRGNKRGFLSMVQRNTEVQLLLIF